MCWEYSPIHARPSGSSPCWWSRDGCGGPGPAARTKSGEGLELAISAGALPRGEDSVTKFALLFERGL